MTAARASALFVYGPLGYWAIPNDGSEMAYGNDMLFKSDGTGSTAHWCLGDSREDEFEWESIGKFIIRIRQVADTDRGWRTLHYEFRDVPVSHHHHSATLCEVGRSEGVWSIPESLHFHSSPFPDHT